MGKTGDHFSEFQGNISCKDGYSKGEKQIQGIKSDRVPEQLWTEVHNIVQEAMIKIIPKKKKCKKAKWLSEEALVRKEEK